MTVALLCTDGSEASHRALAEGLRVLGPGLAPVLVTVVDEPDLALVTGTGVGGGVLDPTEFDRQRSQRRAEADALLADAATDLGLPDAEQVILHGPPARAICELAHVRGAGAVVVGSKGLGGMRRAVLGSVSDHVVRHAPCPVVVIGHDVTRPDAATPDA